MKDYSNMFRFIQIEHTEVQWGSTVGCSYRSWLATRGDRAFSVRAPSLWNTLPPALRQAGNLNTFKLLKMFLFSQAFDWILCVFLYIVHIWVLECCFWLYEALCNYLFRKVLYKLSLFFIINDIIIIYLLLVIGLEIFSKWNHCPGIL